MRLGVAAYDSTSEQLVSKADVTSIGYTYACELLDIPFEDLVYDYRLTRDQISAISHRAGIDIPFDSSREYFLEPRAEYDGETWPPEEEQ